MEIKRVPISEVEVWDKNPKIIKTKDLERLKKQIKELGVYKPLICIRENGRYIALGGNQRLRVLQILKHQDVDISIVQAKDEATKIKYALSDNDRMAIYDEQALAELTYPHIEEINLDDYKIDIGKPISLKLLLNDFTDMGIPSKEDWADAFDEEAIEHLADNNFGIRFVLPLKYKNPLLSQIKKTGNKNKFLMDVLDGLST